MECEGLSTVLSRNLGKEGQRFRFARQSQECSMCGDVGFADQLHQCTRCRFRHQHTYCCNSKEGLVNGTWICDWCRLIKEESTDFKEAQSVSMPSSVFSGGSGALECLLKAALSEAELDTGARASSADGESLCSSSIESVKGDENCAAVRVPTCSSEDGMSQGEEIVSAFPRVHRKGSACNSKRNSRVLRCSIGCQKSRQRSLLEQQCGSVQLKRLSSLKSSKTGVACDPPKSFANFLFTKFHVENFMEKSGGRLIAKQTVRTSDYSSARVA